MGAAKALEILAFSDTLTDLARPQNSVIPLWQLVGGHRAAVILPAPLHGP